MSSKSVAFSPVVDSPTHICEESDGENGEIDFLRHHAEQQQSTSIPSSPIRNTRRLSASLSTTVNNTNNNHNNNNPAGSSSIIIGNPTIQEKFVYGTTNIKHTPALGEPATHQSKDDGDLFLSSPPRKIRPNNGNINNNNNNNNNNRIGNSFLRSSMPMARDSFKTQNNRDSIKLIVLGFFFTTLYTLVIFLLRHLYLTTDVSTIENNGAERHYGFYRHYIACFVCFFLTPLTNELMGRSKSPQKWYGFQPFQGGRSFVCLQAFAWTIYALAMSAILFIIYTGVKQIKFVSSIALTAIVLSMFISQLLVVISINYYQSDAIRRSMCSTAPDVIRPSQQLSTTTTTNAALKESSFTKHASAFFPSPHKAVQNQVSGIYNDDPFDDDADDDMFHNLISHHDDNHINNLDFFQKAGSNVAYDAMSNNQTLEQAPSLSYYQGLGSPRVTIAGLQSTRAYNNNNNINNNNNNPFQSTALSYTHSIRSFNHPKGGQTSTRFALPTTNLPTSPNDLGAESPTLLDESPVVMMNGQQLLDKSSLDDFLIPGIYEHSAVVASQKDQKLKTQDYDEKQIQDQDQYGVHHRVEDEQDEKQQAQQQGEQQHEQQEQQQHVLSREELKRLFNESNTTSTLTRLFENPFLERIADGLIVGALYHSPFFGGLWIGLPFFSIFCFGLIHVVTLVILVIQTYYYSTYLGDAHFTGSLVSKFLYNPQKNPLFSSAQRYFDTKMFVFTHNEMVYARVVSKQALQDIYNLDVYIKTTEADPTIVSPSSNDQSDSLHKADNNSNPTLPNNTTTTTTSENESNGKHNNSNNNNNTEENSNGNNNKTIIEYLDVDNYNHTSLGHTVPYLYYFIGPDRYLEILKRVKYAAAQGKLPYFSKEELTFNHPDLHITNPNLEINRLPPISLIKALQGVNHVPSSNNIENINALPATNNNNNIKDTNGDGHKEKDTKVIEEEEEQQQQQKSLVMVPTLSTSFQYAHSPHAIYPLSSVFAPKVSQFVNVIGHRLLHEAERVQRYKTHLSKTNNTFNNSNNDNINTDSTKKCDIFNFDINSPDYFDDIELGDRQYTYREDLLDVKQPLYNRWEALVLTKNNTKSLPPSSSSSSSPTTTKTHNSHEEYNIIVRKPQIITKADQIKDGKDCNSNPSSSTLSSTNNNKNNEQSVLVVTEHTLNLNDSTVLQEYQRQFIPLTLKQIEHKLPKRFQLQPEQDEQQQMDDTNNNNNHQVATKSHHNNNNKLHPRGCPNDAVILGASVLSYSPCLREAFLTMGGGDVSRNSYLYRLLKNQSVYRIPSGQRDMLFSNAKDRNFHFYTRHYGFIKYALLIGTPLTPIVVFGENQVLCTFQFRPLQEFILKKTRVFLPIFPHGPYFTLFPNRVPLTIVVGEPIFVPVLDADLIDDDIVTYYHSLFYTNLANLFFKYRAAAGFADASLTYF